MRGGATDLARVNVDTAATEVGECAVSQHAVGRVIADVEAIAANVADFAILENNPATVGEHEGVAGVRCGLRNGDARRNLLRKSRVNSAHGAGPFFVVMMGAETIGRVGEGDAAEVECVGAIDTHDGLEMGGDDAGRFVLLFQMDAASDEAPLTVLIESSACVLDGVGRAAAFIDTVVPVYERLATGGEKVHVAGLAIDSP